MSFFKTLFMLLTGLTFGGGLLSLDNAEAADMRLPFAYVAQGDITLMDARNGDILHKIEEDVSHCPSGFSPDTRYFRYSIGSDRSHLTYELLDLHTNTRIPLPDNDISILHWQSNSFHYVLRNEQEADNSIYTYHITTEQSERLMTLQQLPRFYRDSFRWIDNELYYLTEQGQELLLHHNGEVISTFDVSEGYVSSLALSPDKQFVTFVWREERYQGNRYIYVLDLNTDEIIRLHTRTSADWSIDSTLFFYVDSEGHPVIYDTDTQTTEIYEKFFNRSFYLRTSWWSPDERYVAFQSYAEGGTDLPSHSLYILDTMTKEIFTVGRSISIYKGDVQRVSNTQIVYTYAPFEPVEVDGRFEYLSADIWSYNVSTQEEIQLTDTPELDEDFFCMWG